MRNARKVREIRKFWFKCFGLATALLMVEFVVFLLHIRPRPSWSVLAIEIMLWLSLIAGILYFHNILRRYERLYNGIKTSEKVLQAILKLPMPKRGSVERGVIAEDDMIYLAKHLLVVGIGPYDYEILWRVVDGCSCFGKPGLAGLEGREMLVVPKEFALGRGWNWELINTLVPMPDDWVPPQTQAPDSIGDAQAMLGQ